MGNSQFLRPFGGKRPEVERTINNQEFLARPSEELLFPLKLDDVGQFLPLSVLGHFEGAALKVFQFVGGVVELREAGGEILAAIVVDEGYFGGLVVLELGGGDDPAEGVALLAEIAWQRAVQLLSWYVDVLLVEIYLHEDLVFFIKKVRAKRSVLFLCIGGCCEQACGDDGKKSFHCLMFCDRKGSKSKSINR